MNDLRVLKKRSAHCDSAIRWMGTLLQEESNIEVYRVGGDEFAVLLKKPLVKVIWNWLNPSMLIKMGEAMVMVKNNEDSHFMVFKATDFKIRAQKPDT